MLALNIDKKPMLPMVKKGVDIIFNSPKNMFYTGRAIDILFEGIQIDCSADDFEAQAICTVFESGEVKTVQAISETHYAFSLFGAANSTDLGEIKVYRGKKNSLDMGRVVEVNGEPEMDFWNGDECNEYQGTDSTIFPPYISKVDGIWVSSKINKMFSVGY